MKRILSSVVMFGLLSVGVIGCAEKASTTEETKVATPDGATTVTVEKEATQAGDNPPPAKP